MDSQIHTPLGSAEDAEVHRISSEELVYKVDHAQLTDFLHCLRAIQSTSFQEEEFMQMGLRFVVPGIRVFRAAFRGSGLEDSEATTTADQTLSVSSRCDGRVANLRPLSPYSGRTSRQNSINTKTLSPANSHSALDHRPARRCVLLHDMLPLFPGGEDMLVFMKQVALLQTLVTRAIWKVGLHIGQNLLELLPDHPDTEHAPTGE